MSTTLDSPGVEVDDGQVEVARIVVTRTIGEGEYDDMITVDSGDLSILEACGMLTLAIDSVLHGHSPDDDGDHE